MTTTIIGKRPNASAACDGFVGSELPTDNDWRQYVIKALPPGLILRNGGLLWETLGEGRNLPLDADNAGEIIGDVAL